MNINILVGKILTDIKVTRNCLKVVDEIIFRCNDSKKYTMRHHQDCCESVNIEDIVGDITDLLNSPILKASEESNSTDPPSEGSDESYTWTFYQLATINGYVTIRWFGTSNGYYSESVDFYEIE